MFGLFLCGCYLFQEKANTERKKLKKQKKKKKKRNKETKYIDMSKVKLAKNMLELGKLIQNSNLEVTNLLEVYFTLFTPAIFCLPSFYF